MTTSRRDFLIAALTTTGAAMTGDVSQASPSSHEHPALPSDATLRVMSLESLRAENGLVDATALNALVDAYEHKVGLRNGARLVPRAGTDQ